MKEKVMKIDNLAFNYLFLFILFVLLLYSVLYFIF